MDRKYLFDETAAQYELRRPEYGTQLFNDIYTYGNIGKGNAVIEVGCGTGQATLPFLKAGCKVTAVELGTNLAGYTMHKYRDYDNLRMVNLPFEEFICGVHTFDMLVSATAFHWIPAEVGYKKAFSIIKPGGILALFWNKPSANRADDALHQRIQSIYRELLPQWADKAQADGFEAEVEARNKIIGETGFVDVQTKLYHNTRVFGGDEYIELLDTYSDHRALEAELRMKLYGAIRSAIIEAGNILTIYDTVDLHLARKP
jgi:SAM-dependent methyltransferase